MRTKYIRVSPVKGKNSSKKVSSSSKGILQYLLLWLMVKIHLHYSGHGLSQKTINELKMSVLQRKPDLFKKGIFFRRIKYVFINKVVIDFSRKEALFRGSLKSGYIFSTERFGKREYRNFAYLMFAMPKPENMIIGILGPIPKMGLRAEWAKQFIDKCESSTWVSIPAGQISDDRDLWTTFNDAKDSAKKAAWIPLLNALNALLGDFMEVTYTDHPNSIVILESGNFKIKQMGGRTSQVFNVFNTESSGTVRLVGTVTIKRSCHDWFISINGVDFIRLQPSISSEIFISGLTPGQKRWFRHQLITKDGSYGPMETRELIVT